MIIFCHMGTVTSPGQHRDAVAVAWPASRVTERPACSQERRGRFGCSASMCRRRSGTCQVDLLCSGERPVFGLDGWEGVPPAGDHVIVVSHRPRPDDWHPEGRHPVHPRDQQASYYFISDVAQAIAKAKELAGDRTVAVAAGDVGGQALALGLVDEVGMDVVPVVFGTGKRYFGSVDTQHLLEDPDTVIQGNRVLHLRYRVRVLERRGLRTTGP